jgi:hypothetical protein
VDGSPAAAAAGAPIPTCARQRARGRQRGGAWRIAARRGGGHAERPTICDCGIKGLVRGSKLVDDPSVAHG